MNGCARVTINFHLHNGAYCLSSAVVQIIEVIAICASACESICLSYPELADGRRTTEKEAQLMLTNPRDVSRGQSRTPNIVPFHVLRVVSY